jgi:hypothetical protein
MGQRIDCSLLELHGANHLDDDIVSSAAFSLNWLHTCGGVLPITTSRGQIDGYFVHTSESTLAAREELFQLQLFPRRVHRSLDRRFLSCQGLVLPYLDVDSSFEWRT